MCGGRGSGCARAFLCSLALLALLAVVSGCRPKADKVKPGERASTFTFVASPSASDVPKGPVKGWANGRAFAGRTIWFEPERDRWTLTVADADLKNPTSVHLTSDDPLRAIVLLPPGVQPTVGTPLQKSLKFGDGQFDILDQAGKRVAWLAPNSYYVEITKWDVKPYDPSGPMVQVGKASGKVYVAYQGSSVYGYSDSGAAGEFSDVLVRYWGKPQWSK